MRNLVYIFILVLSITANRAHAIRSAAGRASMNMKDPNSLYGLCSSDESNRTTAWAGAPPAGKGYCKTIADTVNNSKVCKMDYHEKKYTEMGKAKKGKGNDGDNLVDQLMKDEEFVASIEPYCPEVKEKYKADKAKFNSFLTNLVSSLVIEESTWRNNSTSWMGAKGFGQLDSKSVAAYGKCNEGCKNVANPKKGVWSAHDNLSCTTYISLHWMHYDSTIGHGKGNKGKSYGIATYFQPFRDSDRLRSRKRRGRNVASSSEQIKRERIQNKMKNFCKNQLEIEAPSSNDNPNVEPQATPPAYSPSLAGSKAITEEI